MMAIRLVPDAFRVHPPIPAEQLVLGTYTFLPHYRSGIAATLTGTFSTGAPTRAEVRMKIPVTADSGTEDATVNLTVRGPGDVLALNPREIIRRYPEPGTPNAEPSDLAHIEFDSPDLPWQFTPTGPDAAGHLPPWLRLIVVDAALAKVRPATANSLAVLTVPGTELPPATDGWAWAHVQVLGQQAGSPTLAQRLSPTTPAANMSRLIAPRQLEKFRDWIACVVPAFRAGAEAGLTGSPSTTTLSYAWSAGAGSVTLPVYDYWTFSTGPDGDFETLAERLTPVRAAGSVGVRRVDTSMPGNGIQPLGEHESGRERLVRGALTRPGLPDSDGARWPTEVTEDLRSQLEAPDTRHFGHDDDDEPRIGPPIYAGAHVASSQVPDQPAWFRDVNLDPADRIAAGLGTRVVVMDQEHLMASAWAQAESVYNTNVALRAAQFGRYIAESVHRRHLARMHSADLLAVTDRVSTRVTASPGRTVRATIDASVLPAASVSGATRRITAPRGRYTRFTLPDNDSQAAARVRAVRHLVSADDGAARSWVLTYTDPDGVTTLSSSTAEVVDLTDVLDDLQEALADKGLAERLIAAVDGASLSDALQRMPNLRRAVSSKLLDRLLWALPTPAELDAAPAAAETIADLVAQILAVIDFSQASDWIIRETTARRVGAGAPAGTGVAVITEAEIEEVLDRIIRLSTRYGYPVAREPDTDTRTALNRMLDTAQPNRLVDDFESLAGPLVRPGGMRDIERDRFNTADLGLVGKLHPKTTITRRVLARLPSTTSWPSWLPPDWFGDGRVEQVMAAPRFPHPMYEALDRYDREWLMPGVSALLPHELVTLLATNARFVEAFLVGCNTEFARELVWRGYPTDGRATSFYSFWTPAAELMLPLHRFGDGSLGSHLDPVLSGAIVLLVRGELVRRYPNMLAHAVTQVADGDPPTAFAAESAPQIFRLRLDPDMLLVGFRLRYSDVAAPAAGKRGAWWFTLGEHVGEPRFGLDEYVAPHAGPVKRDELQWGDLAQDANKFLLTNPPAVAVERPFRADGAHFAWLLFQQPSRAAFAAGEMMDKIR